MPEILLKMFGLNLPALAILVTFGGDLAQETRAAAPAGRPRGRRRPHARGRPDPGPDLDMS